MARFNDIATLTAVSVTRNNAGGSVKTKTSTQVFVNPMTIGTTSWVEARSAGLHADALIELRSCDYSNQQEVTFMGVEYEIERVSSNGEFTKLTLARKAANV